MTKDWGVGSRGRAMRALGWAGLGVWLCMTPLPMAMAANAGGLAVNAEEASINAVDPHIAALEARVKAIRKNKNALQSSIAAGRKATFFCANCHGVDGNSPFREVPTLAGQNAFYLLTQIQKFADGRRQSSAFMQGLVKVLSDTDKINISLYFASQAVRPAVVAHTAQWQTGASLFSQRCVQCHRTTAMGDERIPRLAGQHPEYLVLSLSRYRAHNGQRMDPLMQAVTSSLTNAQIQDIALYLSSKN